MRETIVFAFDNMEQRKHLFDLLQPFMSPSLETGLRIVALSMANEVSRVARMYEATERYRDRDDIVDAIEAIFQADAPEKFSFAEHDAADR